MITTTVGKIFLKAYNNRNNSHYNAKTFFVEQFYPLFFDQQKYMMTTGNSPLENPKINWKKMIRNQIPFESKEKRQDRLVKLLDKIENNDADASIAIGYSSVDELATTSGQVSNMNINISKDDIFFSWIGSGLGIGVKGSMLILFNNQQILLDIFEGWKVYRNVLNSTPNLKGNQINTWNGQWISHKYNALTYSVKNPMANFNPFTIKEGIMNVDTVSWTKVLIAISKQFVNPQMIGYVYNLGQTNTTIGFIPFILDQIRRPIEFYQKLFGMERGDQAELLYGTAFGFSKACQNGSIGVKAMEPKGIRDYIEKGTLPKYKNNDDEIINFNTYLIWIIAMLNNEEFWTKGQKFAEILKAYTQIGKKGKTENSRKIESLITATNKKTFIEKLVDVVSDAEYKDEILEIAQIINEMPSDNVPYFLTLIRLHYAAISK